MTVPSERIWSYWFDGEYGIVQGNVEADNAYEARIKITERHPDDVGADGELNNPISGAVHFPWVNWWHRIPT